MERIIIGLDPGLANTGYGILSFSSNRFSCLSYGCITTQAEDAHGKRLLHIYDSLVSLIKEYKPKEAGIETLYFAKNVTSALSNGIFDVEEYAPNAIKKAVTGIAQATKVQVQDATKLLLGLSVRPNPNHAADALAAAIAKINIGVGYV